MLKAVAGVKAGVDWFDALLQAASPAQNEFATFDKKFANTAKMLG